MSTTCDTFLTALRGCRALDHLTDAEVDRVWAQASAEYGPRLKRSAVRALLLAEGRGWLRPEAFANASEPPGSPLADAVAHAGTKPASPARVAGVQGVQSVPEALLAHALSFLSTYRVQHQAAATCRAFAVASRSQLAYSSLFTTASFLGLLGSRGWWLFPTRRPQRLTVLGNDPLAGRVLRHVSWRVQDVRADADVLSLLPPQTALSSLYSWNADQQDVARFVARPPTLRALFMRSMRIVSREDGRWWSDATSLRELHVHDCTSAPAGLSCFAGFPSIRYLLLGTEDGSDRVSVGAAAAMLRAARIVKRVTVRSTLVTAQSTSQPPQLPCVVGRGRVWSGGSSSCPTTPARRPSSSCGSSRARGTCHSRAATRPTVRASPPCSARARDEWRARSASL